MDAAMALEVAALSRQQAMKEATALGGSDIQRFYDNSTVFLTGGSGFLGKQLIEKLLRSCNLSKVFMLLRPKKGKTIKERLENIVSESVFDALRQVQPDFANKIVAVEGDVAEIRLGIKDEDWKTLTEEVDVIFHVAATTRFNEALQVATLINVRGTREALTLGKACKKLRSYVHVSTAYAQATTEVIDSELKETFYKSPIQPDAMISIAENMEEDRLRDITPALIKSWPNTYTFTKEVAEELIRSSSDGLPICIVRPGVVVSSYSEPTPGWMDMSCIYGGSGVLVGTGMGVLHTIQVNSELNLGLVPCDYVNNTIIAAGRETAVTQTKGGTDTRIYTVSSTKKNPITWGFMANLIKNDGRALVTPLAVYYAWSLSTSNKLLFTILALFLHTIPAYVADFVCLLIGKERRFVKLTKKVHEMFGTLSYFLNNSWIFADQNTEKLYQSLSKQDQLIFNFDISGIDTKEFIKIWCIGCRKYILKDGLKDTVYAVKKQQWLKIVHYIVSTIYIYSIWKLVSFAFYVVSGFFALCFVK